MYKLNVIKICDEPIECLSPFILVENPNKYIKVCLDPREFNATIIREMYQIPALEKLKLYLCNKKIFTLQCLKDSYDQC